jgi:hypothetical protein
MVGLVERDETAMGKVTAALCRVTIGRSGSSLLMDAKGPYVVRRRAGVTLPSGYESYDFLPLGDDDLRPDLVPVLT